MSEERHQLRVVLQRRGVFDGRIVLGIQMADERGRLAWHITTWTNGHDPVEDYWVEGGNFYEVTGVHIAVDIGPRNRIETGRLITGMDAEKNTTILDAIAKWEREEVQDLPV